MSQLMIYGANGYSGRLSLETAIEQGLKPIVAGRNGPEVEALAARYDLEARVFNLDVRSTVDACLSDVAVVLNCAGPFAHTALPLAEACIRERVHYLDITGEVAVFESLAKHHDDARRQGVMMMPGVGFDVVPSDCLAGFVANHLSDATTLRIGISGVGASLSHGTAKTMLESLPKGGMVRRSGLLQPQRAGALTREFDFGSGPQLAMAIPWGDLATAWRSTGIPNIETYFTTSRAMLAGARAMSWMPQVIGNRYVQRFLARELKKRVTGPNAEQRAKGGAILVAEVENALGERVSARLTTPDGYSLTAQTSITIAKNSLEGTVKAGFCTPAQLYGVDFILGFEGVERSVISRSAMRLNHSRAS